MQEDSWTPGRILDTAGGYWQPCTLMAAVELDVFTRIGDGHLTAEAVARHVGGRPGATARLLDALAAMGLLEKSDGRYRNGAAARQHLCSDAPGYLGYMVRHHADLIRSWARLKTAVLTGNAVPNPEAPPADTSRRDFLMGMFNVASQLAPRVAPQIDLSGRRHLLDLGGGPGTWAIYFCRSNPQLSATVCDLPTTRPFAEEAIARHGLADRIAFADCDYLSQQIPGAYDAAWLSHILHGEGPEDCAAILAKTVAAMKPGAVVMIHEFILDDDGAGPLFPALFSLNMLLRTEAGRSYRQCELEEMLTIAGVRQVRRLHLDTPNGSDVILGEVPA